MPKILGQSRAALHVSPKSSPRCRSSWYVDTTVGFPDRKSVPYTIRDTPALRVPYTDPAFLLLAQQPERMPTSKLFPSIRRSGKFESYIHAPLSRRRSQQKPSWCLGERCFWTSDFSDARRCRNLRRFERKHFQKIYGDLKGNLSRELCPAVMLSPQHSSETQSTAPITFCAQTMHVENGT